MRTYFIITDKDIAMSRVQGPHGPALLEARCRAMGPYAHDFGNPVREMHSNNWRVSFEAPSDPSWCLL